MNARRGLASNVAVVSLITLLGCAEEAPGTKADNLAVIASPGVHARTSYAQALANYTPGPRCFFAETNFCGEKISGATFEHAFGFGDFNGDGKRDAFVFPGRFLVEEDTPATLILDHNGSPIDGTDLITPPPGGIHPRKLLVGDLNGDGADDAVLMDHGFDADPFPGAPVRYVLSDGLGRMTAVIDHDLTGFHHAGALGDFDNDGDLDLFVASSPWQGRPHTLLRNNGSGNMAATNQLEGDHWSENIFASEFMDLDGDGFLDLVLGGPNAAFRPRILWGSAKGAYGGEALILSDLDQGDTYDFDAEDLDGDGDRDLIINIVFLDGDRTEWTWLENQGNRSFQDVSAQRIDNRAHLPWLDFLFVLDADSDGDLDVVYADAFEQIVWRQDSGRFVKTTVNPVE